MGKFIQEKMKKAILLYLILSNSITAFSQWRWQNPLPCGNHLSSIYFTSSNTGYAVGDDGTIMKTTDGGSNWTIFTKGPEYELRSVCFTDENTGYAAASGIILRTDDAGASWNTVYNGMWGWSSTSLCFPDFNTGYAINVTGEIAKTSDGGLIWTSLPSISGTQYLNSAFFTNVNTGYVVGYNDYGFGAIIKTINGGESWDTLSSGVRTMLNSVFFTDSLTGFVVGDHGTILKTINAGLTWTLDTIGLGSWSSDQLQSICFTDANTGYVAGDIDGNNYSGNILKTVNAGATWTIIPVGAIWGFNSMFFPVPDTGYALSGSAILKTTNAGSSWTSLTKGPTSPNLTCVFFPDTMTGYAVGQQGGNHPTVLLKTLNGGITWTSLSNAPGMRVSSLFFTSLQTGYMVDFDGDIYKTTTGGTSWTKKTSGTTLWLNSVFFTSAKTGFVAGGYPWSVSSGGIILKTTDAGTTWTSTIVSCPLSSVYFPDSTTGYAVGTGPDYDKTGVIFKTTDGGATWNQLPRETAYALYSVFFTDPNTGYIAGDGGESFKTTDGGLTWNFMQMPFYTDFAFRSVCFPTPNTGYIAGDRGYMFKTINGGITWTVDTCGTANYFTSVVFTDSVTGYVAGSGGTILKKGHGGEPYLTVFPYGRIVASNAGSTDFIISSNTSWRVFSDSSWCTVTPSGSGNDTIIAAYPANTSTESRVDTIRVYNQQLPLIIRKVTVTQRGFNGIENIKSNTFRIYPNPATHEITITDAGNLHKEYTVNIYSISGEFVRQYQCRNQHQVVIYLSDMVPGIYLIKMQTDSEIEVQKLVIQ
jgi:photosystem II stability/assembly factor-like uncharacterized protein